MTVIHASCVSVGLQGVLLLGESGSGKSDTALRLIDRGARLVADDQVVLSAKKKYLIAAALPQGRGLLEVRGLGIVHCQSKKNTRIILAVQLISQAPERLPEPQYMEYLGISVPLLHLFPFQASAPIKIELALQSMQNGTLEVGAFKD